MTSSESPPRSAIPKGHPVRNAEVTLFAVDEGVLSLMPRGLPDPDAYFHRVRGHSVESAISLRQLFEENPDRWYLGNKGQLVGGGGPGDGFGPGFVGEPRDDFRACALWSGKVKTNRDGLATASFPAPDSLTRFKLIAVASRGATDFGNGSATVEILQAPDDRARRSPLCQYRGPALRGRSGPQ